MHRRTGRRRSRIVEAISAAVVVLVLSPTAHGNGRFPRAQRLVESAESPNELALFGTYGLIVSNDRGSSWSHICEAATGIYSGEDPLLELLPGGKILTRTEAALVESTDTWCNWSTVREGSVSNNVQDITRDPTAPLRILALIGGYDPATGFSSRFAESADGGSSWSPDKTLPLLSRGLSLDVAPSSPTRVLVSGLDSVGSGWLLVSDSGGATWNRKSLTGTDSNAAPYLAAISKNDPGRIFVRTDAYQDVNGVDTASDALLLSVDGGTTWATLIQRSAKLFGFALSPDESTLLVGYGDPIVAATYVEPADIGLYRIDMATVLADPSTASAHFEKIFDGSVTCLRWTSTALYACTSQSDVGFEVGRAPDATFTLSNKNPFASILVLPNVAPLACPAGTNGYACFSDPTNGFSSVCKVFGASCDASPPAPTMTEPDASVAPSSGGVSGSSSGGTGGSVTESTGGAPSGGAGTTPHDAGSSSSCACRLATAGNASRSGHVAFLAAAATASIRRRRGLRGRTRCGARRST